MEHCCTPTILHSPRSLVPWPVHSYKHVSYQPYITQRHQQQQRTHADAILIQIIEFVLVFFFPLLLRSNAGIGVATTFPQMISTIHGLVVSNHSDCILNNKFDVCVLIRSVFFICISIIRRNKDRAQSEIESKESVRAYTIFDHTSTLTNFNRTKVKKDTPNKMFKQISVGLLVFSLHQCKQCVSRDRLKYKAITIIHVFLVLLSVT